VVSDVVAGWGDLGMAQSDVVYLAYRRGIESNRYPHKNLRAIAVLWVNNIYVVVRRDSPIHSIKDLKGRRVGIIMPGTAGEFSTRTVLTAYGMSYSDVDTHIVPKLGRGELDAVFTANPVMPAVAVEVNQTVPLRLLQIEPGVIKRLRGSYPFLRPVTVPADELPGQAGAVETLGAEWLLVCRSGLSEDVVYQLTKEFLAQLPDLATSHGEAALIDPEQAPASPIPLHPGAARYYREREVLK
jgi:TRAP transporter TAXI family solute receptor